MSQPSSPSLKFEGTLFAGGASIEPAALTICSDCMVLYSPFERYQLEPKQVVAVDVTDQGMIAIQHVLIEYPERLGFSPLGQASEVTEAIEKIGFLPTAEIADLPSREGLLLRLSVVLPLACVVIALSLVDALLGWSKLQPVQLGRYSPLCSSALFMMSFSARFIPPCQRYILQPGRHIGEITPSLNALIVISGLLALASILMLLRVPEFIVLLLCFGLVITIFLTGKRMNGKPDEPENAADQ